MKILSVNAGSSSLKFTLIEMPEKTTLASGLFEKIGLVDSRYTIKHNGEKIVKEISMPDHSKAVDILMEELISMHIINSLDDIEGVGHRLVHGGPEFTKTVVLNDEVIEKLIENIDLAPLHNPGSITGMKAFMQALPNVIQTVVFDTAFHATMEETEYLYPVPYEWYEKYKVRKYGFHGTSHRFINKTISEYLHRDDLKIISCHIGNGGSVTAINAGKVVDTSMGFTPLAGIMMGTRCGDIDASILEYVSKKTGENLSELTNDLNKKSASPSQYCINPSTGGSELNDGCYGITDRLTATTVYELYDSKKTDRNIQGAIYKELCNLEHTFRVTFIAESGSGFDSEIARNSDLFIIGSNYILNPVFRYKGNSSILVFIQDLNLSKEQLVSLKELTGRYELELVRKGRK